MAKTPAQEAIAAFATAKKAATELRDGAIRCTVPDCGGIVRADFALTLPSGTKVGLCPQRDVHDALKAKNPAAKQVISAIAQGYRLRKAQGQ